MEMEKYPSKEKNRPSPTSFRSFWERKGHNLPPFFSAPSTRYYFECEKMLFEKYFPDIPGKKILKTDLWDEAKNTQILNWAADKGAEVYGLDISSSIAHLAKYYFNQSQSKAGFIVNDLRYIAFGDESFDYLYSMGTIEHFTEYHKALKECYRVLKKKGIAIIGVPNRYDPFLRPLMVALLYRLNLYAYGYEKSFSMKSLENILQNIGFRIIERTGILLMPGLLRMIDLFFYVKRLPVALLTAPFIFPFVGLYKKFPFLKRHGYLIACVAEKP